MQQIEFRDADCEWVVPEHIPGIPRHDELHVTPKTDAMREELRAAIGGQVVNKRDKALYPRRYDVVREEDGVFILVVARRKS